MSEIRERAKIAAKEMKLTGWDRWAATVTDLLEELEQWKKALESLTPGGSEFVDNPDACASYLRDRLIYPKKIIELQAELERVEKSLKVVQSHAKSAMDKLPERWNMGFQAGLKQAVPYENEIQEALRAERQGRKDDNVAFTEEILRLEAENAQLKKSISRWEHFYPNHAAAISDGRKQAAMECVEIVEKYPAFLFGTEAVGVKLNLAKGIKDHFGLGEQ